MICDVFPFFQLVLMSLHTQVLYNPIHHLFELQFPQMENKQPLFLAPSILQYEGFVFSMPRI